MNKDKFAIKEKTCPATGKQFLPKRENQIYIDRATQIRHNNIQAKIKQRDLKLLNDIIKQNAAKLERLYNHMIHHKLKSVPFELVEYEQLDFESCSTKNINNKTGNIVNWCMDYGYEPTNNSMTSFFIYKKSNA